jgi:peptide/nickel transport system permease protein
MSTISVARPRGLVKNVAGRILSNRVSVLLAAGILFLHLVVAATGPLWASHDPVQMLAGDPYASPSAGHLLGTDNFGRDVFSRLVAGERLLLGQAIAAAAIAVAIGSALGTLAAYARGWIDALLMRCVELALSVPSLILSMLLLTAVGSSRLAVVAVVAALFVAPVATVIRGAALGVVAEDFVLAAQLRGERRFTIVVREIIPNVLPSVFVEFSLRSGFAAILIGALGFLGFGAAPPTPDWGLMISEGRSYLSAAPWSVLAPSLALGSLVVALSLLTERAADRLSARSFRGGRS